MSAIQPKAWEGHVKIVETRDGSGVFTLKPHPQGKYSAENLQALLKALMDKDMDIKPKLDGWKVWLDGDFDVKLNKGQDVTQAMLAKLVKEADDVQLVYVKRPFPQPKLKFTKGTGNGPIRKDRKAPREL